MNDDDMTMEELLHDDAIRTMEELLCGDDIRYDASAMRSYFDQNGRWVRGRDSLDQTLSQQRSAARDELMRQNDRVTMLERAFARREPEATATPPAWLRQLKQHVDDGYYVLESDLLDDDGFVGFNVDIVCYVESLKFGTPCVQYSFAHRMPKNCNGEFRPWEARCLSMPPVSQ